MTKEFEILIEKYRPKKLDDVVGQDDIVRRLKQNVKSRNIPHLLFAGPAGNGKTSSSIALAKEMYGKEWKVNFMELNASDTRGIDVIRNEVKEFASAQSMGDIPFKIILLDEADNLTNDAQSALRRTMEKYSASCRFILSCNYSSKIIAPIQSRTAVYRFKRLNKEDIISRCKYIVTQENIKIDDVSLEAIAYVSDGDMRRAVGMLDTARLTAIDTGVITIKDIYNVSSYIDPEIIKDIIKRALSREFFGAIIIVEKLLMDGLSGEDIIKQMTKEVMNINIDDRMKVDIVDMIGEAYWRMSEGANELIILKWLVARIAKIGSLV